MIGDILAKLGRRETLTTAEQQEIRLWGNQSSINNSYVAGLQNGRSAIDAESLRVSGSVYTGRDVLAGMAVRLKRTASQNAASGATLVQWDEEEYDDANFFDGAVSNTNINIPVSGRYQTTIGLNVTSVSAGIFVFVTKRDGVNYFPAVQLTISAGGDSYVVSSTDERPYSKGEVVTVELFQPSGSTWVINGAYITMRLIRS